MLPRKFFATPEELEETYLTLGSMKATADYYGVSKRLILNKMNQFGIKRCFEREPMDRWKEVVGFFAMLGLKSQEIAGRLQLSVPYVLKIARTFDIEIQDNFHVGFITTHNGYKLVKCEGHPKANKDGYVREHRLVMEEKLGRYLTDEEIPHHINGDKLDNRPENLELFATLGEHTSFHHSGKSRSESLKR